MGDYIRVTDDTCMWSEKECWSCKNHDKGWSFPTCKACLKERKTSKEYYPRWLPRIFNNKDLEESFPIG